MTIYQALYCPCIHESSYYTISAHRTKKGAKKAIKEHKLKTSIDYAESLEELEKYKNWRVNETELLD